MRLNRIFSLAMTRELAFDLLFFFSLLLTSTDRDHPKNNKVGICILLLLVRRFAHAPQWVVEIFINWLSDGLANKPDLCIHLYHFRRGSQGCDYQFGPPAHA